MRDFEFAQFLGDNCLILAQGNAGWAGHAPALDEDIAIANVALDLIGQARLWLGLAGEIEGRERRADDVAYLRDAFDFRNLQLVEQPNGDYGQTLMRQYLFDAWHLPLLEMLRDDAEQRFAEIAAKAVKEAAYHLERSRDLIIRLGDGTAESNRRMQAAVDLLWPFTGEYGEVAASALFPDFAVTALQKAHSRFEAETGRTFAAACLNMPPKTSRKFVGARGEHTEHLGYILAEMQFLQRAYPGAIW